MTLRIGKTKTLKIKGTSAGVKWVSSNKSVVAVTQNGRVKGNKKGKAIITAKVGQKRYKCFVTVLGKNDYNKNTTEEKVRKFLKVPSKATCRIVIDDAYF